MSLLEASPKVEAYRCEPLSIGEIDDHPDSARIWATIMEIRKSVDFIADDEAKRSEQEIEGAVAEEERRIVKVIEEEVARISKMIEGGDMSKAQIIAELEGIKDEV